MEVDGLRGGDGDREAEVLELAHQALRLAFGVASSLEVVVAQVLEHFASAEEVPDQLDQAMGDSHCRLVRPAAPGDLAVLGAEVAALGSHCGSRRFDHGTPQPLVTRRGGDAPSLPADS